MIGDTASQLELMKEDVNRPPGDSLVISVRQPWAWLIINAGKNIENRDWRDNNPGLKVRGRVLIHASKGITKREWEEAWACVRNIDAYAWGKGKREIMTGTIERGGIIGSVEIVNCVTESESPWFFGRHGFVLRDPQPLPFYRCNGQLGFFRI
jgi:hypothetical protein